jgi:hypothetical protein
MFDAETILYAGLKTAGYDPRLYGDTRKHSTFRKLYGIEPVTAFDVINDIQSDGVLEIARTIKFDISKFFLTLYWLRIYAVEEGIMRIFGIGSRVTARKHIRIYLNAIHALFPSAVSNVY